MQPDSYDSMRAALAELGFASYMQNQSQLVVSSQEGPVWPNRGNSFWLSLQKGAWYLSTWLPASYRIPVGQDVLALCSTCMLASGTAMYRVPADIISRFGLQELDEAEFDSLFETEQSD